MKKIKEILKTIGASITCIMLTFLIVTLFYSACESNKEASISVSHHYDKFTEATNVRPNFIHHRVKDHMWLSYDIDAKGDTSALYYNISVRYARNNFNEIDLESGIDIKMDSEIIHIPNIDRTCLMGGDYGLRGFIPLHAIWKKRFVIDNNGYGITNDLINKMINSKTIIVKYNREEMHRPTYVKVPKREIDAMKLVYNDYHKITE